MSSYALILIIVAYLSILFLIAFFAEKRSRSKWVNNPWVYTLSLAVYCSAWTYYGSIGIAAKSGIGFLPIYLGPVIAMPLWIIIMRKILRISKQHKISSLADFISLRYGQNRFLGALITVICLLASVPYIALQLKAISETFEIMTNSSVLHGTKVFSDSTFYIALILALFATFYGTQTPDASEKHRGIITSVAFESVIKLVFFLIVGIYVTFYLFDGTTDIYHKASALPNFENLISMGGMDGAFNWFFLIAVSFMAIFLLPRQFQVSVVENSREKHLKKAIWLFPLYLLLFNVFVIFIAWAGNLTFGNGANADYYTLLLPLNNGDTFLALLVFLGGFSAVISMVIVSTLALSTMVSNNLVIPYGYLRRFANNLPDKNASYIKNIRRVSIFLIMTLAYIFYIGFSVDLPLYSIGLMSFVIIAQLAPAFFIGLFWNRGSSRASIVGMITGFAVTFYTLILPFTLEAFYDSTHLAVNGPWNIEFLKPHALFGLDFFSPPVNAFFWSMVFNILMYIVVSLSTKGNYRERNYAEMFVDSRNISSLQDSALVWKGEAYVSDIKNILRRFLGEERTERAMNLFFAKYDIPHNTQFADARLINFSEKLLTGSIGGSSAKILISNVVKEEEISLVEVLKILEESKETIARNKSLKEKSNELTVLTNKLKEANLELREKDQQKDEFLDTVAHELKTPITGIRASAELLQEEYDEMPEEIRNSFIDNILNDSERLSRLINNILDFEKLTNGRVELNYESHDLINTISKAVTSSKQLIINQGIKIEITNKDSLICQYDEDRILQVLTNLLSNAIKYVDPENGVIKMGFQTDKEVVSIWIEDNGKGIDESELDYIFEKFYQSKNQNTVKPQGSGLGLAISKHIIEKHRGKIWIDKSYRSGVRILFTIPIIKQINEIDETQNSNS